MSKVLLISNSDKIKEQFRILLSKSNVSLNFFTSIQKVDFSDFKSVLIIEPYILKGEYFSIFSVWKRYLADRAQDTKLIIAGFKDITHPNYINLLDLTAAFNWISKTESAYPCTVEWPDTLDLKDAPDILDMKLSSFFTGHNHDSIIDCIAHVRATLNNANIALYGSEILKKEKQDFELIWKTILIPDRSKLREFYNRWQTYIDYFDIMPFNIQLEKIAARNFADRLNDLFSGLSNLDEEELKEKEQEYRELNAFRKIGRFTQTLQNINKKYINPEFIANVLLIDDDTEFHRQMKRNFAGFYFSSIYDAKEVEDVLKNRDFDLILMDLQLNGQEGNPLEGVDLIPLIKRLKRETPLVIVSTHYKSNIIRRTLKYGADYYLVKATYDVEKWNDIFVTLLGPNRFTEKQIIKFNNLEENSEKPGVLIVDDKKEWVEQITSLSNKYNYRSAFTIQQAKDILKNEHKKYDLLILDLYYWENGIEYNHGIELLQETKIKLPNLPIIVMTRSMQDKDEVEALWKGADFYLPKPQFNSQSWLKSIDLLIETKKLKEKLNS